MPRFNIYIREADISLWDSIENKSDFIHKALRGTFQKEGVGSLVQESPKKITDDKLKMCKKGHLYKGIKCMQKGC